MGREAAQRGLVGRGQRGCPFPSCASTRRWHRPWLQAQAVTMPQARRALHYRGEIYRVPFLALSAKGLLVGPGRGAQAAVIQKTGFWHVTLQRWSFTGYRVIGSRRTSPTGVITFFNRESTSAEPTETDQCSVLFRPKFKSLFQTRYSRSLILHVLRPKCVF